MISAHLGNPVRHLALRVQRLVGSRGRETRQQSTERVFSSYQEALAECRGGYTNRSLVDSIFERQKAFYYDGDTFPDVPWYLTAGTASALPLAFLSVGKPLRVLDFGGSVGTHFAYAAKALPHIPISRWAVVETAEFAARAAELQTDRLRFFDDIGEATAWLDRIDYVTTAGAVQYAPDPAQIVGDLVALRAPVLALHRCAFAVGAKFVAIQKSRLSANARGPLPEGFQDRDVEVPISYLPESYYGSIIEAEYVPVLRILNEGEAIAAGHRIRLRDTLVYSLSSVDLLNRAQFPIRE